MTCFARALPGRWLAGCAALAAFAGCSLDWSAEHIDPGAGGGSSTTSSAAGGDPTCPPSPPTPGADCQGELTCEYGEDLRPDCRLTFDCDEGSWNQTGCTCAPPSDPLCPESEADPAPTCPPSGTVLCDFGDGKHCGCVDGAWICPSDPDDCPDPAPNTGTPCSGEDRDCNYGDCALGTGILRHCSDGIWEDDYPGCMNADVTCN